MAGMERKTKIEKLPGRPRASQASETQRVTAFGPQRFFNRELSWLQFNIRVLEESNNINHPLLERIRFLSISASNLDEFYMVRVAGLIGQINAGIASPSDDGLSPTEQLKKINEVVAQLTDRQQKSWVGLRRALEENGIAILDPGALTRSEREWLQSHFFSHVFPVLTPIAIDPAHPFPFIPNQGFVLALECLRKEDPSEVMHSILPIPSQLNRFIRLPTETSKRNGGKTPIRFIRLETLVAMFAEELFRGFKVRAIGGFREIGRAHV